MLNEDKIKLMTGIAMFEKREGKRIFPVNRYFRSDYISRHMFRSFFSYTICYLLCAMIWVLYYMEKRYEFQNRARELSREGSRHDRTSRN